MKFKLCLDIVDVDGDGLAGLIKDSAARNVELTVTNPRGPGGGAPVVDLVATLPDLVTWLLDVFCDGDGTEVLELLQDANAVK